MKRLLSVVVRGCLLLALFAGAWQVVRATRNTQFTTRDKAYYADANTINFVRPGLVTKVTAASIATDGTVQATVKITDAQGLLLDKDGINTPGAVSLSFLVAAIPKGQTQFTSYTTRVQTSPITNQSATQASSDSGGSYSKVSDGIYTYTFKTHAPSGYDRSAAHRLGVYSSRNLADFNLGTQFSDDVFDFTPDGSALPAVRDVVSNTACNSCHNPLNAHGGARQKVALCVMCHTPQTTDPDTGNTVDFPVMIHKIHTGSSLPSVQAGKKYQIIGFNQTVADFSDVIFPPDVRNCQVCHQQGPKQASAYLTPNQAACGACHDDVNFATGKNHVDLPQADNTHCAECHQPQGELEFDASILGAHTIKTQSQSMPGTVFSILNVNGTAGKSPTVTFTIKDKSGKPILPSDMTRLALILAGPNTDYTTYVSEDARTAKGNADGTYTWTFAATVPAGAAGSYTVAIEGYRNIVLVPGTPQQVTARDAGLNKQFYFAVDSSKVMPRRQIVAVDNCNRCHLQLSVHGGNRNDTKQCVICHNPTNTDSRPATLGPKESIDFRTMIHKIHGGKDIGSDYMVLSSNGTGSDFTKVVYPGDLRDCAKCHVNNSQQVPVAATNIAVTTPRGYTNPTPPTAAACLACHTGKDTAIHAAQNTTVLGESCEVCHGTAGAYSVDQVHAH